MARYGIDDFIRLNTNEFMDFDGSYGNQCVDLFNFYNQQVIGGSFIGTPLTGGAADLWNNFDNSAAKNFYTRIPNTPTGVPQYGDVIIWKANQPGVTGSAGHVGIFLDGDVNSFNSFDQNYPTNSPCHSQHHANYAGVYGWLRPITPVKPVAAPAPVPVPVTVVTPPPTPVVPDPTPVAVPTVPPVEAQPVSYVVYGGATKLGTYKIATNAWARYLNGGTAIVDTNGADVTAEFVAKYKTAVDASNAAKLDAVDKRLTLIETIIQKIRELLAKWGINL